MKTRTRNTEGINNENIGSTRRFYLNNKIFDELCKESALRDISISQLLREKLEIISYLKNRLGGSQ